MVKVSSYGHGRNENNDRMTFSIGRWSRQIGDYNHYGNGDGDGGVNQFVFVFRWEEKNKTKNTKPPPQR